MEKQTETQRAIEMINEIKERYMVTQTEACKKLGITRMHYTLWTREDYEISNRVFNRILYNYNKLSNVNDNNDLIKYLQETIDNAQRQLDVMQGK